MPSVFDFEEFLVTDTSGNRVPLKMSEVGRRVASARSPEQAIADLVTDGLTNQQASLAVDLFQAHNTLETDGVWNGLTCRQRRLAEIDAANCIYMGNSPEQTVQTLLADGFSKDQADEAVRKYLADHRAALHAGAPKLMAKGLLVTTIGIVATLGSYSVGYKSFKVFVGAIVLGIVMLIAGMFRRLRS